MLTFEEFVKPWVVSEYKEKKILCGFPSCRNYAEFNIGDSRCPFPACVNHSGFIKAYRNYVVRKLEEEAANKKYEYSLHSSSPDSLDNFIF